MTTVNVPISNTIKPADFLLAISLLTDLPVGAKEDFTRRRRCMVVIDEAREKKEEQSITFETEDFRFLKSQFEFGLQSRNLTGNNVWDLVYQAFKEAEKD